MTDQEKEQVIIIKKKVDEATESCWNIIVKKAIEAGINKDPHSTWLFFSRVVSSLLLSIHKPMVNIYIKDIVEDMEVK